MSPEPVRSYLLGTLEECDSAAVEERYFTDRSFFLFVQTVETALIEDYLAGKLSRSLRTRFESRYLSVPDLRRRLEEVRGRQILAQAAVRKTYHTRLLLLAAVLFICAGGATLWLYHDLMRFESLPTSPGRRPLLATLSLSPGLLKGEGAGTARLGLPSSAGNVQLVLEIPGQRTPVLCSAHLSLASPDGGWKRIWSTPQPVWSSQSHGGQQIVLILDWSLLRRGHYLVELFGTDEQVRETYSFSASMM